MVYLQAQKIVTDKSFTFIIFKRKVITDYIKIEVLKKEIAEARKIYIETRSTRDVTKKSIEEIAATAIEYLKIFRNKEMFNENNKV